MENPVGAVTVVHHELWPQPNDSFWIDHSGRYAALVPAFQGIGQAVAPTLAGTLLSYQLGYSSVMVMCALASAVALLIYGYVYRELLRVSPEIADKD